MDDVEKVKELCRRYGEARRELGKVIVGQEATISRLFTCLLAEGHCLLVGVPGLAKTLLVRSLGEVLGLGFNRIQFTPDLMPSDITGTEVIQEDPESGGRLFRFVEGPVFSNLLLADEINRTPPKTQAALLEAMQERQVTAAGKKHPLPHPFFVLATQNPIEQEGTYPLPEAQLDRFMFQVVVDYPSEEEEFDVILSTTSGPAQTLEEIIGREELVEFAKVVRQIPVADYIGRFALAIVRNTRPQNGEADELVRKYVSWGSGPRGGQNLVLAAKAHAALNGRLAVEIEDILSVCGPVLSHRIKTNYSAEAEKITSLNVIESVVEKVSKNSGFKINGLLPQLLGSAGA
ncbi:MAG: MoxR family ATPase [Planctomycetota bacterium]|nr:MoxR family ATPase [Planctomycetota bacterium]